MLEEMNLKIILSRKGFDEKSGGEASPIYDGKFIPFPIPRADSEVFYKELSFSESKSYLQVMKDLNITQYSEAHLDPDLVKGVLRDRHPNWMPAFGQSGTAQSTLATNQVQKGDLFLFFGWYKNVDLVDGRFKYLEGTGRDKGFHAIYGYMEVSDVFDLRANTSSIPDGLQRHPHVYKRDNYSEANSLYVASKKLSFDATKPGAGCFNFRNDLVLTQLNKTKSRWLVPRFFKNIDETNFNAKMKFGAVRSQLIEMTTSGRTSQELLITTDKSVVEWAQKLIRDSQVY